MCSLHHHLRWSCTLLACSVCLLPCQLSMVASGRWAAAAMCVLDTASACVVFWRPHSHLCLLPILPYLH